MVEGGFEMKTLKDLSKGYKGIGEACVDDYEYGIKQLAIEWIKNISEEYNLNLKNFKLDRKHNSISYKNITKKQKSNEALLQYFGIEKIFLLIIFFDLSESDLK